MLLLERRFHGHIANPTAAAMKPPRLIFWIFGLDVESLTYPGRAWLTIKRGKRAVKSHPALIEFAEMFVLEISVSGDHSR